MWYLLVLVLVALVVIKVVRLSLYWQDQSIAYEPFPNYVIRMLSYRSKVMGDVQRDVVERYGPVFGTYRGFKPAIMIADLEVAREVLIKQFNTFFHRSFEFKTGNALWDNTITQLPYDSWKIVRTVMGYTFTTSKMRGIIIKLDKVAKRLVDRLESEQSTKGKESILLNSYYKGYSMDSITAISFGLDLNCVDNPNSKFVEYASNLIKPGFQVLLFLVFPKFVRFIPFVDFPPRKAVDFFGNIAKEVLQEKRKHLDKVLEDGTADIMDLHLQAQREDKTGLLTDEVLASQGFLFLIAALELTAMTLELTTFYLAVHPEIQEKVFEELREIRSDGKAYSYEDVHKAKYLDACVLETFRITPISPFLDRICGADTTIAGIDVKEGTIMEINVASIHQDPKYFEYPEKFMPERFLDEESKAHSAFLLFGDGPRNCVGRRLALMNIEVLLINLILNFKIEATPETPSFPLKLKNGLRFSDFVEQPMKVRLCKRE